MAITSTGSFPIGLRQTGRPGWQSDLDALLRWAESNDFPHLDLAGPVSTDQVRHVMRAGLGVGSVDLLRWSDLLSPSAQTRRDAVRANVDHVTDLAALGVTVFFAVAAPADPTLPRRENFAFAVESYSALCDGVAFTGATVVLEGAAGKPPHFANIACTPADIRALRSAVGSDAFGINFDPSHPVRMGIDPVRFLREFAPFVYHVHAKDTLILGDDLYEHGHLQQATFAQPHRFGAFYWRYTLPGIGNVPWPELLEVLREAGYAGRISIELEDEDVEGEESEQSAFIASRDFLNGC